MSVLPNTSDGVIMHELVKGDVFEFIGIGHKKNWIVFCKLSKDWFEFVAMYKTFIPHVHVAKKVNGREPKCVQFLEEQEFLARRMENSRLGGRCTVRKGRVLGTGHF